MNRIYASPSSAFESDRSQSVTSFTSSHTTAKSPRKLQKHRRKGLRHSRSVPSLTVSNFLAELKEANHANSSLVDLSRPPPPPRSASNMSHVHFSSSTASSYDLATTDFLSSTASLASTYTYDTFGPTESTSSLPYAFPSPPAHPQVPWPVHSNRPPSSWRSRTSAQNRDPSLVSTSASPAPSSGYDSGSTISRSQPPIRPYPSTRRLVSESHADGVSQSQRSGRPIVHDTASLPPSPPPKSPTFYTPPSIRLRAISERPAPVSPSPARTNIPLSLRTQRSFGPRIPQRPPRPKGVDISLKVQPGRSYSDTDSFDSDSDSDGGLVLPSARGGRVNPVAAYTEDVLPDSDVESKSFRSRGVVAREYKVCVHIMSGVRHD